MRSSHHTAFKKTLGMARSIFQYIRSIYTRWRIYKVFISPIIEWYLPVTVNTYKTAGSKNDPIESFQHQILALVSGACSKSSSVKLARTMAEMPVALKIGRMATRLRKYIDRDVYSLLVGNQTSSTTLQTTTRSGRTIGYRKWAGLDKKCFGDMIHMHAYEYVRNEERKVYMKNELGCLEFDETVIRKWVRINNKRIRKIAKLRYLGLID